MKNIKNQQIENCKNYELARDVFTNYGRFLEYFNYKDDDDSYEKYLNWGNMKWKEYETCYQEFYNKFYANREVEISDETIRSLFLSNGGLNWRMETARNEIELFIVSIMNNLIEESEESEGLAITDLKNDKFYCFLKEELDFEEVKVSDDSLELHIRDKEKEVVIKLDNDSELKSISHYGGADIFQLEDFYGIGNNILLGYL